MSRALDAQQVFLSARPTLTAVGFVWPPLPTILQLPLVIFPPLRVLGLSANVLTAITGAAALVVLNVLFRELGLRRFPRYAALLGLGLNPMTVFYAANGMSEIVFIAFMLLSYLYLLRWHRTGSVVPLTLLGLSVGLAFLARYDAAVHGVLLVPVLILLGRRKGLDGGRIQASVLAYAVSAVYLPALWIWFNFQIIGNPLNFLRGEYSNAAQIGYQLALLPGINDLRGDIPAIIVIVGEKIWELFPVFWVALVGILAYGALRRDALALAYGVLALSFPAFQFMNLYAGQSAGFLRYFMLAIPLGVVLLGYLLSRIRWKSTWSGLLAGVSLVGLLLASGVASAVAMNSNAAWGQWNDVFVDAVMNWRSVDS